MAAQTLSHRPRNLNAQQTARMADALRIAQERFNALSPAEMLNADIRFDATDMDDPYRFNRENARAWR
jgi:hypothetical protein